MSLVTEEIKSKSEVYHGDEISQQKTKELLKELSLPNGILPLEDIIEFGYNKETGFVWHKQKKSKTHKFEEINTYVYYETEVSAYVSNGKINKLNGVKAKGLLVWIRVTDIIVDDPPTGKITFKTSAGISKTFPVSAFEVDEKSSGVKEI